MRPDAHVADFDHGSTSPRTTILQSPSRSNCRQMPRRHGPGQCADGLREYPQVVVCRITPRPSGWWQASSDWQHRELTGAPATAQSGPASHAVRPGTRPLLAGPSRSCCSFLNSASSADRGGCLCIELFGQLSQRRLSDELEAKTLRVSGLGGDQRKRKSLSGMRERFQGELGGEQPALESGIRLLSPPNTRRASPSTWDSSLGVER
jgi:hypothetical protein